MIKSRRDMSAVINNEMFYVTMRSSMQPLIDDQSMSFYSTNEFTKITHGNLNGQKGNRMWLVLITSQYTRDLNHRYWSHHSEYFSCTLCHWNIQLVLNFYQCIRIQNIITKSYVELNNVKWCSMFLSLSYE